MTTSRPCLKSLSPHHISGLVGSLERTVNEAMAALFLWPGEGQLRFLVASKVVLTAQS